MSIETTKNVAENLTIHAVTGPVVEEEMYDALEQSSGRQPTALILWDMSQAEVDHVTVDVLKQFVGKAGQMGKSREGGRTAVVAPGDLQFGLARMSEAFNALESAPYSLRAFRTREEALEWLKSDEPD